MAKQTNQSMISETSICNQALSWLGQTRITSLEDPGTTAEWCRDNYPFIRDAVLEERMWTFAQAREVSTVSEKSPWGDRYQHPIPLGWLAVYRVFRDEHGQKSCEWSREGRFILTRESTVYLWGLQRIVDTGAFTSLFSQAVAARLAAEMAIPITENPKMQADMWALYQAKLADAATRDGQQGANERIRSNSLINARGGGYSWP